jgi:hypothetical protein
MIDVHIVLDGWWLGGILLGGFLLTLAYMNRSYTLRVKEKE